ncbi:hypothetical protein MRB53_024013 [Persea americana]|uniref:Uncharacterized protein n=1 Tax=Persea americana TaxID=3435 RepID=A0ACC2LB75_PERAE|nr:hypothetical protein MRB53_024013 [Persea americana]
MAVDFCTESSSWTTSPRVSFSYDLIQSDGIPVDRYRPDNSLPDPSPDFDFCISRQYEQESSSADELFSDGKIRPLQFKSPITLDDCPEQPHLAKPTTPESAPAARSPTQEKKRGSLREIMSGSDELERPAPVEKPPTGGSRSFWPFRRSSSLNSGNGHKSSSIWSLQLLSRSNSTGSTYPSPKHHHSKQNPNSNPNPNPNPKPFLPSSSSLQKPPLRKNSSRGWTNHGSYTNGIRISPVLNVPPPYISRGTTNLFGFGSLFRTSRKEKKMKKKPSLQTPHREII